MDKSAIDAIRDADVARALNEHLARLGTRTPVVAVPQQFDLASLEPFLAGRSRYRGTMTTPSLVDFIDYCLEHVREGSCCFVDVEQLRAKTIFDLGTQAAPGHGEFVAELAPKPTSEYAALREIDGADLSPSQLAQWFEDWSAYVVPRDAEGKPMEDDPARAVLRQLSTDPLGFLEETASPTATSSVGGFEFTCQPYTGLTDRPFEVRIEFRSATEGALLVPRIRRLDQIVERIGRELTQKLSNGLGERLPVRLGTFAV